MKTTCPNCQHSFTTSSTRAAKAPADEPIHPGSLASQAELYAYYKATAPRADVQFTRDHCETDQVRTACDELLNGDRPITKRDAYRMFDLSRGENAPIPDESAFWTHHAKLSAISLTLNRQAFKNPKRTLADAIRSESTWPSRAAFEILRLQEEKAS